MKTYRLFFVSVYRFIWNTFLYDISSILLIIIFKLYSLFYLFIYVDSIHFLDAKKLLDHSIILQSVRKEKYLIQLCMVTRR